MGLISKIKSFVSGTITKTSYMWMNNTINSSLHGLKDYIQKAYQANADVYAIASFIAGKGASVPFLLYEVKNEKALMKYKSLSAAVYDRQVMNLRQKSLQDANDGHRIMNMLNKAPNDYMTASEFKFGFILYRLLTGNSFIRGYAPEMEETKFVELHLLPSQFTVPIGGGQYNAPRAYRMTWDPEEIPGQEVSHTRYFNPHFEFPSNPHIMGQSPLQAAARVVTRSNSGYDASIHAIENGGMAGILYQDGGADLSEPQRELFTYVEKVEVNEYELHKEDPYYLALYKEKSKASKKLKAYLFDKRHETHK